MYSKLFGKWEKHECLSEHLGFLILQRYHPRVLYVDIDVHHGDGVEEVSASCFSRCLHHFQFYLASVFFLPLSLSLSPFFLSLSLSLFSGSHLLINIYTNIFRHSILRTE